MFASDWTVTRTRTAEAEYADIFPRIVKAQHPQLSDEAVDRRARYLRELEARGHHPFQRQSAYEE